MADELYINDALIELPEKSVALTKQINDIGDVKDRQANFSNAIEIPKTPKNVATFKMLGITGTTTRIPYENVDVRYVSNGMELIKDGRGIVKNTNVFFNLIIYDGNSKLTDDIGDKTLKALDWSTYNHTLTTSLYLSKINSTSGYIYAFGYFYDGFNQSAIDRQVPSLFVHTVWDEIFIQNGLTYSGAIFSDSDFKSRLFTPSVGYDNTIVNGAPTNVVNTSYVGNISHNGSYSNQIFTDVITSGTFTQDASYTIQITGNVEVFEATLVQLRLRVNGAIVSDSIIKHPALAFDEFFDVTLQLNLQNGDTYSLEFYSATDEFYRVSFLHNITVFKIDYLSRSVGVDFSTMFDDETQIAFVKDIMQRFGLIFKKTLNTNNYEFVRMQDLLDDKVNSEDWTDKNPVEIDESYKSNYAQNNHLKYLYDDLDSNVTQTFADGIIEIDNVHLPQIKTLFISIFKASNLYQNSLKYRKAIFWELDDNDITQPVKSGLRLFKKTTETRNIGVGFSDDDNVQTTLQTIAYLDLVDYQTELDNNFSSFNGLLNDYKSKILNVNLSLLDIYNLDFFKLKFFRQLGKYFYLNKVINFQNNKITQIEVIEVGEAIAVSGVVDTSMEATLIGGSIVDATLTQIEANSMSAELSGGSTIEANLSLGGLSASLIDLSDVIGASNINKYVLVANGTTGYVARLLVKADISDLGSVGTVTNVSANAGIIVSNPTTTPVLTLNFAALSIGDVLLGTDYLTSANGGLVRKQLISSIPLSIFNNDSGWTSNTGDITQVNITAGTGLSGSVNTTTGNHVQTLNLTNTAVTPGSYTSVDITVDAQGRITSISNGSGGASQLSDLSDVIGASNINKYVLVANGTTGYVARLLVKADISDLGSVDNYTSWALYVDGVHKGDISTLEKVNLIGGNGVSLAYSTTLDNTITINEDYTTYVAILNQLGTSAPTATVIKNTLGGTVVWAYSSIGGYTATLNGAFTLNKTSVIFSNGRVGHTFGSYPVNVNIIGLTSGNLSGTSVNNSVWNGTIEIKVYS